MLDPDFGGLVIFGGVAPSTVTGDGSHDWYGAGGGHDGTCAPGEVSLLGTTGLQSYGLGIPQSYIQGIGNSNNPFDNIPMGFFLQDNWRLNRHLTVNYGVRYDAEISPLLAPPTAVNTPADNPPGTVERLP